MGLGLNGSLGGELWRPAELDFRAEGWCLGVGSNGLFVGWVEVWWEVKEELYSGAYMG